MAFDPKKYLEQARGRDFFKNVENVPSQTGASPASPPVDAAKPQDSSAALLARLAPLGEADRAKELTKLLRSETAAFLGLPSPEVVDPAKNLVEFGFDSLMAVNFANQLKRLFGPVNAAQFKPGLVLRHKTVNGIALHLVKNLKLAA